MKPVRISQMTLVADILEAVARQGIQFTDGALMNLICDCATKITKECERERVYASEGMGLQAWLASDDTGLSSRFMAAILAGRPAPENNHPRDSVDFGRCVRMLKAAPELRIHIPKMKKHGIIWNGFADKWDELEAMYEADPSDPVLLKSIYAITDPKTQ